MEFGKPRQSLTGIVGAEEDRVWNALPKARVQGRDAGFQALAFARIAGKARFSASFQSPIGAMPAACHELWPRTL
jgi:hypothetical protein